MPTLNTAPASSPDIMKTRLWGLLALGILIHLGFGWLLTLSVDEAHYAYYAVKLDWSYFDHPPLVGWIQWPLVAINAPDGLIRVIPETLWLISCLLARRITLDVATIVPAWNQPKSREAAGIWAVALILLAPLMHVLAVGLLPDTLLMTLSLLVMLVTLKLTQSSSIEKNGNLALWSLLGLLLGLSGLAKYTAILPAMAVIAILILRKGPRILIQPGPWVALLIAGLMVLPVFYWNAQHDWISFLYQINHGAGGEWKLKRVFAFFGIQFAAYGPLLVIGGIMAIRHVFRSKNWYAAGFLLFFLIPFLITAFLAGGGGSLPHWTAPAWLAITPFAANALASHWYAGRRKFIRAFTWIQAILCAVAFTILFFAGIPFIGQDHPLGKKNPIADLRGWDEAGSIARDLASEYKIPSVSVANWTLASRLAWYARPLPVHVLDDRFDQFDIWFGQIPTGSDSLFVNWSQMRFDIPTKTGGFETCTPIRTFDIHRLGRIISDFTFYHCRNWGAAGTPSETGKSR